MTVVCDDQAVAARLGLVFDYFGLVPAEAVSSASTIVLRFSTRPGELSLPSDARAVGHQDGIRAWEAGGDDVYLCAGRHVVRIDLSAGVVTGTLPSDPAAVRKDLVVYSLLALLRRRGYAALHAACVARDDAGYVFAAACNSGKSTNAYSLVRQGWRYLSDDSILLRRRGDAVEALSLRRDLSLTRDDGGPFSDDAARWQPCPFAEDAKQRLDVRAVYPEQVVDRCTPSVIVFPEIVDEAESRLSPVEPSEALFLLVRHSIVMFLDASAIPRHLDLLTRLVRQCRCYRLSAGRDLKRAPAGLAQMLAAAAPSTSPLAFEEAAYEGETP